MDCKQAQVENLSGGFKLFVLLPQNIIIQDNHYFAII